jgi:eukaryotic-like serine/threonine-protein kinase
MKSVNSQIVEVAGYHLTGLIGSGGMGDVYKGYQDSLNRPVAVKILHQKEFAERFKNEAYIQSSINHPNIARLYEYRLDADRPCIVMEYVEGESLDSLLKKKGKLSNGETENIIGQIASALAYLHKKQIMHRDVKPQNFKMQPDGAVKMLDFGIAKHKYSPKLTQLGFVVGTLEYIAPEQFREKAELKSDVWALTVMTYELITGYLPFEANNPVTLRSKITNGSFTDPKLLIPDISDPLLELIEKGLKVNPANRITAAEIENLLGRKKNIAPGYRAKKSILQQPLLIAAIVLTGIIMVLFLGNRHPDNTIGPSLPKNKTVEQNENKTIDQRSIMINVSGIQNAEIIFNDNLHKALPYPVQGKEGDKVEFTIHAEGYKDKKVQIEITSRRNAYEFDLEKINN